MGRPHTAKHGLKDWVQTAQPTNGTARQRIGNRARLAGSNVFGKRPLI